MGEYAEMMIVMGCGSISGIYRLITGLEERGRIRRLPNQARSIEVVSTSDQIIAQIEQLPDEIQVLTPIMEALYPKCKRAKARRNTSQLAGLIRKACDPHCLTIGEKP